MKKHCILSLLLLPFYTCPMGKEKEPMKTVLSLSRASHSIDNLSLTELRAHYQTLDNTHRQLRKPLNKRLKYRTVFDSEYQTMIHEKKATLALLISELESAKMYLQAQPILDPKEFHTIQKELQTRRANQKFILDIIAFCNRVTPHNGQKLAVVKLGGSYRFVKY